MKGDNLCTLRIFQRVRSSEGNRAIDVRPLPGSGQALLLARVCVESLFHLSARGFAEVLSFLLLFPVVREKDRAPLLGRQNEGFPGNGL